MASTSGASRGYQTLPQSDCIRLLTVKKVTSDITQSRLTCSLDTVRLQDHVVYLAISYTWGSPVSDPAWNEKYGSANDVLISVSHNGGPAYQHAIGRNLFEGLVQIHDREWQSYLWADAICINQADVEERERQVNLMDKIFTQAHHVIAWLGTSHSREDEENIAWLCGPFADFLEHADKEHGQKSYTWKLTPVTEYTKFSSDRDPWFRLGDSETIISRGLYTSLSNFFNARRFRSRGWMLQELTLPSKSYVILYGKLSFAENKEARLSGFLSHAANVFVEARDIVVKSLAAPEVFWDVTIVTRLLRETLQDDGARRMAAYFHLLYGAQSPESQWLSWLEYFLGWKIMLPVTIPHDEIYCVVGMVNDAVPTVACPIQIDYEQTVEQLFTEVVSMSITKLEYMTVLSLLPPYDDRHLKGLPSWVPDLTCRVSGYILGGVQVEKGVTFFDAYPSRLEAERFIERQGSSIFLFGKRCGEVVDFADLRDLMPPRNKFDKIMACVTALIFYRMITKILLKLGPVYRNGQLTLEAVIATLHMGRRMASIDVAQEGLAGLIDVFECLPQIAEVRHHASGLTRSRIEDVLSEIEGNLTKLAGQGGLPIPPLKSFSGERLVRASTYAERTLKYMACRGLFLTSQQHIGVGLSSIQPGDQIWILCRSRIPHVLRPLPEAGRYLILGEAYVHAGMDGELIDPDIAGPTERIALV